MNNGIFTIAKATAQVEDRGIYAEDTFTFTSTQLDEFIKQVVKFQQRELQTYRKEELERFTYMEDDIPSLVLIMELEKVTCGD